MNPAILAQRQLDAYNQGDIDAFCACFAEDVEVSDQGASPSFTGRAALRERYGPYFAQNPALNAALVHRIVQGNFAIDHEHVTGRADGQPLHAVAIYEVKDALIQRVWFLR